MYDTDFEEKCRLKIGSVYKAKITLARNIRFHRKYFALINAAWAFQSEQRVQFFKGDVNLFRKTVEVAAGFCERVYNLSRKEWQDVPKSISFSSMKEEAFADLYERVKDVLFNTFLTHITEKDFTDSLRNF